MVDAMLAESLIGEGRRKMAGGDPARAARLLRKALGLWRGPALGEFIDRPFAATEASRLEELREAALEDLVQVPVEAQESAWEMARVQAQEQAWELAQPQVRVAQQLC